jgi:hypothetical protein
MCADGPTDVSTRRRGADTLPRAGSLQIAGGVLAAVPEWCVDPPTAGLYSNYHAYQLHW